MEIDTVNDPEEEDMEEEEDEESLLMKEERVPSPIEGSLQMIYKSLWISENDHNNVNSGACDVCLSHDDDEGDELVMCDGCNLAVH